MILGFLGIAYGVFISYNGVLLVNDRSDTIFNLLDSMGMTPQEGARALITVGSAMIVLFLLVLGLGGLGIISSGRILRKRNLFWFAIILTAVFALFGAVQLLSWVAAGIGIILLLVYTFAVYVKYNVDQRLLKLKRKEKQRRTARIRQ